MRLHSDYNAEVAQLVEHNSEIARSRVRVPSSALYRLTLMILGDREGFLLDEIVVLKKAACLAWQTTFHLRLKYLMAFRHKDTIYLCFLHPFERLSYFLYFLDRGFTYITISHKFIVRDCT